MRVVVTRPEADSERTATALRKRGHEVLVAPLMRVEPIKADLSGDWGAVVITSANAPMAIAGNPARDTLLSLPTLTVGQRSADAARGAGFTEVSTAGGDVHDMVRQLTARCLDAAGPLLYLAGEDRAADLVGELAVHGIAAEMRVVYRVATAPLPLVLIEALKAGEVDAVVHFSRRSAENYLSGAANAGVTPEALKPLHVCLAEQVASPLVAAGAPHVSIAARPDEASLIELLTPSPG
jgi:uroporphyrinogen-III synthase